LTISKPFTYTMSPPPPSTTTNPILPDNHPLTIARLQQSARDILRGFENAMASTPIGASSSSTTETSPSLPLPHTAGSSPDGNHTKEAVASFEQAFRTFFTSCTLGASMATNDDDDDDDTLTTNLNLVEGAVSTSTDSSVGNTSIQKGAKIRSKSATSTRMISSTKASLRQLAAMHIKSGPPQTKPPNLQRRSSDHLVETPSSKIAADHIYEHLFFAEEQARRAAVAGSTPAAVSTSQSGMRSPPLPLHVQEHNDEGILHANQQRVLTTAGMGMSRRRMTQPFPMSSPPQREQPIGSLPVRAHASPMSSSQNIIVSQNRTFDDDISAISAHTLEAMVTQVVTKQSSLEQRQPVTEEPPAVRVTPPKILEPRPIRPASLAPPFPMKNELCRASTIPHANTNHGSRPPQDRDDAEPPALMLSRDSSSFFTRHSNSNSSNRSPSGLRYGTPQSQRSSSSNHSNYNPRMKQQQRASSTSYPRTCSFSPNSSSNRSSGNQSFDRWQSVEQQFWESVVANDDDKNYDHDPNSNRMNPSKKSKSQQQHRRRRSSADGWSGSGSRSRTADSTTLSSTVTGGGLSQRSSSWLGLHPQHHPHETFPYTIPVDDEDDGVFLHPSSYRFSDSAEI
jgi:hypothetical protein